jgi:hypothetical protein
LAWPQLVVTHFPLDATRIDSIPARHDTLFEDFVEDPLMKGFLLPRGE